MTKYKLEYIWLDGKEPIPELRGKTTMKSFEKPPTLADLPLWGFDGSSTMQAEGHKSDHPEAGSLVSRRQCKDAYIVLERSHVSRWHTAPHQCARDNRRRPRSLGWFLSRSISSITTAARSLPEGRLSRSPGPLLLRGRIQHMGGSLARQIVEEHLESTAAGINHGNCRSREGPVGIPDLRQGLQEGR